MNILNKIHIIHCHAIVPNNRSTPGLGQRGGIYGDMSPSLLLVLLINLQGKHTYKYVQRICHHSHSPIIKQSGRYSTLLGEPLHSAELSIGAGANLVWLVAGVIALEAIAGLAVILARVGNSTCIAIVGIDTAQHATIHSHDIIHDNVPRARIARAVAAGPDNLAVVLGVEVLQAQGGQAIHLDDLVARGEGAAAGDGDLAFALEGDGVLADVLEPDVGDGAGAEAVDAFGLVGADDDVGDGGAVLEDKDGVVLAGLLLFLAYNSWKWSSC